MQTRQKHPEQGYQHINEDYDEEQDFDDDVFDEYEDEQESKFETNNKHQDWPFAVLFLLHILAISIMSAVSSNRPEEAPDTSLGSFDLEQRIDVMQMAAVSCVIAAFFVLAVAVVLHTFTQQAVMGVLLSFVVANCAIALVACVTGSLSTIFTFLLFAVCSLWYMGSVQSRVPFATSMLKLVLGVTRLYPATLLIGLGAAFLQICWLVVWSHLAINLLAKGSVVGNLEAGFLVLSLYWTCQVLRNVVHVAVAGTMATWYFMHETGMPLNPTMNSFRRASTTSFGSVCLGSLFIAFLRTIRTVVNSARRSNNRLLMSCASCLFHVLDRSMSLFNVYAFTQVAMYGKPFVQAGKDTWELVHSRGVDMLINHDIVSTVCFLVCVCDGLFTALCGSLWASQHNEMDVATVAGLCFVIGVSVASVFCEVVESGVACMFVCYAEDPEILSRADPVMFSQVREGCCVEVDRDL